MSVAASKRSASAKVPTASIIEEPEVMPPDWTLSSGMVLEKMHATTKCGQWPYTPAATKALVLMAKSAKSNDKTIRF